MTSLAEIMGQASDEVKISEPPKEVSKGTNGETGVAGIYLSIKKTSRLVCRL